MEKFEHDFGDEPVYTQLVFFVNGKKVVEPSPDPEWTLLYYLRRKLQLCGTKLGCGEGGCGACTVMLSKYDRQRDTLKHIAVNACLTPVCAVHGQAVTTVEGIGSTRSKLHPVQERIAKSHGSQCGFCTPGIVMSMYTLLRTNTNIKYDDIETALQGNLCRCTGYRPIIEGFKTFSEVWEQNYADPYASAKTNGCSMGEKCCKNRTDDVNEKLCNNSEFKPYDKTQEPIFPPELKLYNTLDKQLLIFRNKTTHWIRPTKLRQLLDIKKTQTQAKIVVGNSEIGVEIKFKKIVYPILLSPSLLSEMNAYKVKENCIDVGALVTLTDLKRLLDQIIIEEPPHRTWVLKGISDMLHWFAGAQIRNVASLVGNIMTASPISDLNPILMASNAQIYLQSTKGCRSVRIDDQFFTGYRRTLVNSDEVVTSVEIPFTAKNEILKAYKQSKRKEDDISIVTAAFYVKFDGDIITDSRLCFGGMGTTTLCAIETSNKMKGMRWNGCYETVFEGLIQELELDSHAPGGMISYRKSLCLGLFLKFYVEVLSIKNILNGKTIDKCLLSSIEEIPQDIPRSSQCFEVKRKDCVKDTVGKPIVHASAFKQASGEAIYCDDIPHFENELYLVLVFSEKSHARIISIDASEAISMEGVVSFLSAKDIQTGQNVVGPLIHDEEVFASEFVTSRASVIGAIVAYDEYIARKASSLVKIKYEEMPCIVTLEDAIEQGSFYPGYPRTISKGDVEPVFKESKNIIKGHSRNGAQEHFYLETHCSIAIPKEDELEIISSSQHPSEIAQTVARVLGMPNSRVTCKVKRLGGGFGGKESRAMLLALPVAIAAHKLRRPVRASLDRDEDMQCSGYRHPHLIKYKVAFTGEGQILAASFDVYNNAGCSMDLSSAVNERSTVHLDNIYYIPNVVVNGYVCKTNLPSNTAFRGFGAPQAMLATESMIRDIANKIGKTYEEVAVMNMYKEGDLTHFNQVLTHCTISRCWQECIESSNYYERKRKIEEFNSKSRYKKKGLSIVSTKYGISFQVDVLMQGGALVHIYTDGSVLVSIGGIEMGQGLYTKMIQIASKVLDIDVSKIHISDTVTDKVPNSSPTAGSISSDLYGMAVLDACNTLRNRLEPVVKENPNGKWEDWVLSAFLNRISLSATGFFRSPKIEYDLKTNSGKLFEYFTYGVACSEVLIDCLTGDHNVLRTDIVMDLGDSINPAIDIGQIEGAFMQGYGFYTIEELIFSPKGDLYSKGPGAYKIPGFGDIPREFNVSLLKGAPNPRAVYSSKAVGEPPLFLASSVFFAIKEAVSSARKHSGVDPHFHMDAPATCARIRMACEDDITRMVGSSDESKAWNVMA